MSHFQRLLTFCFLITFLALGAGAVQAQLPDVQITLVDIIQNFPVAGQTVDISATIYNAGPGSTPKGVPVGVGVTVDGNFVGSFFVRNLGQNGPTTTRAMPPSWPYTFKISPRWVATAGVHQICATADDINRFPEVSETNNTTCITVNIPASPTLPDAVIPLVQLNQPVPGPGVNLPILVSVRNVGATATPSGVPVGVGVQADGVYLGSFFARNGLGQTDPLDPGEIYQGTVHWTTVAGTHQICAFADDIDRFAEADETNNSRCLTIEVVPQLLPDVTFVQYFLDPAQPSAGQTVRVNAWVENIGNAGTPVGIPVGVGFQANGAYIGSDFVRDFSGATTHLVSGQISGTEIDWVATSGTHQICAFVDDIDRFVESNENNNSDCLTIHVP